MQAVLQNPLSSSRTAEGAIAVCVGAVMLMVGATLLPPWRIFAGQPGTAVAVHLLLELFSVVVAALVVIMAWHTIDRSGNRTSNVLIVGFGIVAGVDLAHALSYEGMPPLLTESATAKAVFFWLTGRIAEITTMTLVAARIALPGRRAFWLAVALFAVFAAVVAGNYRLDRFPVMFVPGHGVTPLKASVEYVLCAWNVLLAGWLFVQYRRSPDNRTLWMAVACFVVGIGELAFTNYLTTSDFINVFGHLFKTVAYAFVYRATFRAGMLEPYELLERSERLVRAREAELDTLLRGVPAGIACLDRDLRYRYVNPTQSRTLGRPVDEIIGRRMEDVLPPNLLDQIQPNALVALRGRRVDYDLVFTAPDGEQCWRAVTVVPERGADGVIAGVVAIFTDTTERERIRRQLVDSVREVVELKAALDAHAIVAVTDARGVITRVNDKFCDISQYSREELVGRTHRVINSGHHGSAFFKELWATISRGEVWNGEICNRAKDGSLYWVYTTIVPFRSPDGTPLQYIAIRADITKRKQAEQEAQHMAFHDALTGLPNRRLMGDRLRQAVTGATRQGYYGALLLLDLDNFKEVNDTLGHVHGDELLRETVGRLLGTLRQSDTVARLGGDEFVVILEDLGANRDVAIGFASDLGEKIRETLSRPYEIHGHRVVTTPSMGVVLFGSNDGDPDELLKQADMALYKAKAEGRNRTCFFDPSLQADITARAALLRDLRHAQAGGEFALYYQPVVDERRRVVGVEALLRWKHPDRGHVSPAVFIPLAEQTDLILPIGQWVLETACAQLVAWSDHPVRSRWTVAINVSEVQFRESAFVAKVRRALDVTGADPARVRLELTESMLHSDLDETVAKMLALRQLGVRFSLDDFGTGYSSLRYLKKLPLDQLKIDQSFVADVLTDVNDAAIARTILALAGNLDLDVVAEGVETAEQMGFLERHGCRAFQGYLFSRPVPADQLGDVVQAPDEIAV